MPIIKCCNQQVGGRSLKDVIKYIQNPEATGGDYGRGRGVLPFMAYENMDVIRGLYHKRDGRQYAHFVISPREKVDKDVMKKVAQEVTAWRHWKGFQILATVHCNTRHTHIHIVVNSVNAVTGRKYQQSRIELNKLKKYVKEIFERNGLENEVEYIECEEYFNEEYDYSCFECEEEYEEEEEAYETCNFLEEIPGREYKEEEAYKVCNFLEKIQCRECEEGKEAYKVCNFLEEIPDRECEEGEEAYKVCNFLEEIPDRECEEEDDTVVKHGFFDKKFE